MMVMMDRMVLVRKWIIVMVIFCLLGTLTQACSDYEEEEKCYEEKEEIIDEEKIESTEEAGGDIIGFKWFIVLDKLIERYPIIERILERIFNWIFDSLLDLDY